MGSKQQTQMPLELATLAQRRPRDLREFRDWCVECVTQLVELELPDAEVFGPTALHAHAALLLRQALVYVRRYVDPAKADQMPRVGEKCISHALIRFQDCIAWCDSELAETGAGDPAAVRPALNRVVQRAYDMSVAAEESMPRGHRLPTDRAIYKYIAEQLDDEDRCELPSFDTWQRYVRAGRRHYDTNRNTSRAERSGRSIVHQDEI